MICTIRKSTLSLTTVFLLPVMRFAKLNKLASLEKKKKNKRPPGGLNRGFMVAGLYRKALAPSGPSEGAGRVSLYVRRPQRKQH